MFYERIQALCQQQNTSVSAMLKALGLSTGSTGNWKRGQLPKGDILAQIAQYLNTSMDYLVFGKFVSDLNAEELHLLALYRDTPDRAKYKVLCDFESIVQHEQERAAQGLPHA